MILAPTFKTVGNPSSIPLEGAKGIVVRALNVFDPRIGETAGNILYDGKRLNTHPAEPGQAELMQVRPAYLTMEQLGERIITNERILTLLPGGRQDNPKPYAIIDLEYDGTVNGLVVLAHETGHAVADDLGHQSSLGPIKGDDLTEIQAYYIQMVFYDGLSHLNDIPDHLLEEVTGHKEKLFSHHLMDFITTSVHEDTTYAFRTRNLLTAQILFETAQNNPEKKAAITNAIMGADGPLSLEDVLRKAGLTSEESFSQVLSHTTQRQTGFDEGEPII